MGADLAMGPGRAGQALSGTPLRASPDHLVCPRMASAPTSRVLSSSQLATLAKLGEERTAKVGEKLFEVGDASYPFIAIQEGEVAITDSAGREIVRHGASGFLGEMNLLSGQTVFLTAVVTEPTRYIAVDREVLRKLLFEDGTLSDLLLSAFIQRRELLQRQQGIGIEIVGPHDSADTRRLIDFARAVRNAALQDLEQAPGVPQPRTSRRRPCSSRWRRRRSRSSASPAVPSCATRATASSRGRWASGWS